MEKYEKFKLPIENSNVGLESYLLEGGNLVTLNSSQLDNQSKIVLIKSGVDGLSKNLLDSNSVNKILKHLSSEHLFVNIDILKKDEKVGKYDLNKGTSTTLCEGRIRAIGDNSFLIKSKSDYNLIVAEEIYSLPIKTDIKGGQIFYLNKLEKVVEIAMLDQEDSTTFLKYWRLNLESKTEKYQQEIIAHESIVAKNVSYYKNDIFILSALNNVYKVSKENLLKIDKKYEGEEHGSSDKLEIIEDRLVVLSYFDEWYALEITDIESGKHLLTEKVISGYFHSEYDILRNLRFPDYNNIIFLLENNEIVEVNSHGQLNQKFKIDLPISKIEAASKTHFLVYSKDFAAYYLIDKKLFKSSN